MIHWSGWAQQPDVRIACTQEYTIPKISSDDTDQQIYVAENECCYSFDTTQVTCGKYQELESFQLDYQGRLDFANRVAQSGLPEDQYVKQLIGNLLSEK